MDHLSRNTLGVDGMLIRMTLKNWLSFRDETHFYMTAGAEKQHRERLAKVGSRMRLLPISAVYGGNASGKSNFYAAFLHAKKVVLEGQNTSDLFPVIPFHLGESRKAATSFCFEFLSRGKIYEYSFEATSTKILREKLLRITRNGQEYVLFDIDKTGKKAKISFQHTISEKKENKLRVVFEGTGDRTLFITNAKSQRFDDYDDVIDWFASLRLIGPDTPFSYTREYLDAYNKILSSLFSQSV